jgi:hypothetical protein
VEGQITPGRDRTAIQNFGRELVEDSPLSERVSGPITQPSKLGAEIKSLVRGIRGTSDDAYAAGKRALRTDVKPSEGTAIVRNKSFFDKEASPSSIAAGKAAERATRDAVKQAVPATRPLLRKQGDAMDAAQVLEAMGVRDGARDSMSFTGAMGLSGQTPMLGVLMQVLRNSQLPLGHLVNRTGGAMSRNANGAGQGIAGLVRMLQSHED